MDNFPSYHFLFEGLIQNVSHLCLESNSRVAFSQNVVGQMRGWRHRSDYSDLLQRKKKKIERGGHQRGLCTTSPAIIFTSKV